MADAPAARKRPVAASRTVAAKRPPASRTRAARSNSVLEDDAPTTNYALRLTESVDAAPTEQDSFALRLSEALEAISTAQSGTKPHKAAPVASEEHPAQKTSWLAALDKLPPIRLPIGPPIPWRLGLPAMIALVMVMGILGKTSVHADTQGVQLPAEPTYPVEQTAPLFTSAQPTPTAETAPQPQAQSQLGVQDPGGLGFDVVDLGIKLVAVLALAYGSLMLLKRVGVPGSGSSRSGGSAPTMRVVSSLVLAPNRSIHVIKAPGGRTLLVGATVNTVNLLADLGDLAEDEVPDGASLIDALKGKIGR